jgi:hypothetical protein
MGVRWQLDPNPPWLFDTAQVISAIVPDEHGVVTVGSY